MNQPLTSLMPSNAVSNVGGGSGGNIENQSLFLFFLNFWNFRKCWKFSEFFLISKNQSLLAWKFFSKNFQKKFFSLLASLNHQHHQNLSNNNSNTNLFYSLASALATGNMDTAIHLQQKMASLFASGLNNSNNCDGKSVENDENSVHIPLANGPPIVDIRSKFVDNNGNNSMVFLIFFFEFFKRLDETLAAQKKF